MYINPCYNHKTSFYISLSDEHSVLWHDVDICYAIKFRKELICCPTTPSVNSNINRFQDQKRSASIHGCSLKVHSLPTLIAVFWKQMSLIVSNLVLCLNKSSCNMLVHNRRILVDEYQAYRFKILFCLIVLYLLELFFTIVTLHSKFCLHLCISI